MQKKRSGGMVSKQPRKCGCHTGRLGIGSIQSRFKQCKHKHCLLTSFCCNVRLTTGTLMLLPGTGGNHDMIDSL